MGGAGRSCHGGRSYAVCVAGYSATPGPRSGLVDSGDPECTGGDSVCRQTFVGVSPRRCAGGWHDGLEPPGPCACGRGPSFSVWFSRRFVHPNPIGSVSLRASGRILSRSVVLRPVFANIGRDSAMVNRFSAVAVFVLTLSAIFPPGRLRAGQELHRLRQAVRAELPARGLPEDGNARRSGRT